MSASLPFRDAILPAPVLIVEDEVDNQARIRSILLQLGYEDDALVTVGTLVEARGKLGQESFALALVDIGLPDGSGLDLIRELRGEDPSMGILVISAWSTEDTLLQAIRSGVTGYVLKERDDLEIMLSIRSVLRGGAPIDPFIARRIMAEIQDAAATGATAARPPATRDEAALLSPRETEILRLVADGLSNREIADALNLSRYTVECHIKHVYRKLAASSRTRAVNEARQRGLLA